MATVQVWPGLDADGDSLTVYAEDGVTLIPAVGGADVPYTAYYSGLIGQQRLLTYDPLELSGEAITVPPIARLSSGLVGELTADLPGRPGLSDGETLVTLAYGAVGDGGGATWRFALGVSSGADGFLRVNASNGQWQMVLSGPVNIKQIGCKDDNATDCASIINAYIAARMADAAGSNVVITLEVPPGANYYYLASTIRAPGGNNAILRLFGHGVMRATAAVFGSTSWQAAGAMRGSVFRAAQNVDAFSGSTTAAYSQLRLEDLGIIGAGRGTGMGVNVANPGGGNCQFSHRNLHICNCYVGVAYSHAVTCKSLENIIVNGCFVGEWAGRIITDYANTDSIWIGQNIQVCNIGIWMQSGDNLSFYSGLIQGCAQGIRFAGDGGSYGLLAFKLFHMEANGWYSIGVTHFSRADCVTVTTSNDTLSGLGARNGVTPTAGQRVLVAGQTDARQNGPYTAAAGAWSRADTAANTHAGCVYRITGGTYASTYWQISNNAPAFLADGDNLVIAQKNRDWDVEFLATVSATSVHFDQLHSKGSGRLAPIGNVLFTSSGRGFDLDVASGVVCTVVDPQFESYTIDHNATYQRPPSSSPTAGAVVLGGTISHDWGNDGDLWSGQINANVNLAPPTNAPKGAKMTWFISQDATGGRTITVSAGLNLPSYSNTGNTTSKRVVITARHYGFGVWYEESVSPWA